MSSIRIVLADDHAIVRDGLRALLGALRDMVVVAAVDNGRAAIAAVLEHRPDIVVMDISMPDMNGIEAARRIGEVSDKARVLVLSMHSSPEHVYRALEAGARGYLLKESAGARLEVAVRTLHAGRRFLDDKINETVIAGYLEGTRTVSPLEALSPRERTILQLLAEGHSNAEAAAILSLSPKTVETYRSRLMTKLQITDLATLVKFAIEHGVTHLR